MRNGHIGGRSRDREGFVDGNGVRIYYKTLGSGVPLLVLHGGPGSDHSDFLPALQPLARRCQLVLIDERGSGRSERLKDPKGYTLNHMVKDIERVGYGTCRLPRNSWCWVTPSAASSRRPMRPVTPNGSWDWCSPARARARTASIGTFATSASAYRARLRARLARLEKAGIFQADGAYKSDYAAASAEALAPHMYVKPPQPRYQQPFELGMEVLREMWVRRSDFRIDGNLKGFDFTRSLARVQGAEPRRDRRSRSRYRPQRRTSAGLPSLEPRWS